MDVRCAFCDRLLNNLNANFCDENCEQGYHEGAEECETCGGDGYSGHECGEDTCCCNPRYDNIRCESCGGFGLIRYGNEKPK